MLTIIFICSSAHLYTDSSAGISVLPLFASVYSTVGGIVLYCFLVINPSCSSSLRHFVSIVAVMPVTFRSNSRYLSV